MGGLFGRSSRLTMRWSAPAAPGAQRGVSHSMGRDVFLIYAVVKLAIYSLLCGVALVRLFNVETGEVGIAVRYGFIRLIIGATFGIPIYLIFTFASSSGLPAYLSYLLVLVPARYLEWSLLLVIMARSYGESASFDINSKVASKKWLSASVLASCLADVWLIFMLRDVKYFC